jgi:hypothetical protein
MKYSENNIVREERKINVKINGLNYNIVVAETTDTA